MKRGTTVALFTMVAFSGPLLLWTFPSIANQRSIPKTNRPWSSFNDFALDKARVAASPIRIDDVRLPLGY
jgi:hypothetical protein